MRRRLPSAAVLAAALCALVAVLGVLREWRPFLTTERDVITATPSLAGIFQRDVITVRRGREACIAPVPFNAEAAQAELLLVGPKGAGPAEVTAEAPGYRATARAAGFGVGQDVPVRVRLASPDRLTTGRLCVRNAGRVPFGLVGTAEGRSNAPATTSLEGEPQAADAALTLYAAGRASILDRLGTVLDHAGDLTGGLVPRLALWVVAVGLLLGTVAGLPYALWRAVRDDDGERAATGGAARGSRSGSS